MSRQIDHKEHERFLKEINSLPIGNQLIAQRMGTDSTRISHYRNGTKWPSRRTLLLFQREFRNDLDALEDEQRKRKGVYKEPMDQLSEPDEKYPREAYPINPISQIEYHLAYIENSVSVIRTVMGSLAANPNGEIAGDE